MTNTPINPAREENLYKTPIPGGFAEWWRPEEMPPRRKREVDVAGQMTAPALVRALQAAPSMGSAIVSNSIDDMPIEDQAAMAGALTTTEQGTRDLFALNELLAWAYLKSWTLTDPEYGPPNPATGVAPVVARHPRPLPETPDDILDLERDLYDALLAASAKIRAAANDQPVGFTVDSVENPASPTGGSDA